MMKRDPIVLFRTRSTAIWIALVVATAFSWWLGTSHGFGPDNPRAVGIAVLAIGFVKARFVGLDFMEVREAPVILRAAMELWIFGVFGFLAVLFYWG